MSIELPKVYEPQEAEGRIYENWEKAGCFKGRRDPKKKPFTIVMPPPNVTPDFVNVTKETVRKIKQHME